MTTPTPSPGPGAGQPAAPHLRLYHPSTAARCRRVDRVCPDTAMLYAALQKKRELVAQYFIASRHTRRYDILIRYARELFDGRMQNVYLSAPPPPPHIIRRMILDSYPALMTCIHARYFCEHGYEHNFMMMIVGPGGVGKTTYVAYLSALLGGVMITSEDEILFGIMDIVHNRKWVPLLVLDDINAILSKYWYMNKEERAWSEFFKMIDYAKDLTTMMLVTARNEEGPPKRLRELTNYTGFVRILPFGTNLLYFVEWYAGTKPSGVPVAVDLWWPGLRLPEQLWRRIKEVRRLRSEILLIQNTLKLAEAGKLTISEQKYEELLQKLEELREQLVQMQQQRFAGIDLLEEDGGAEKR